MHPEFGYESEEWQWGYNLLAWRDRPVLVTSSCFSCQL